MGFKKWSDNNIITRDIMVQQKTPKTEQQTPETYMCGSGRQLNAMGMKDNKIEEAHLCDVRARVLRLGNRREGILPATSGCPERQRARMAPVSRLMHSVGNV